MFITGGTMRPWIKRILAGFDPLPDGTVVDKKHYQSSQGYMPKAVMAGKTPVMEMANEPRENTYVLVIHGVTKHGFEVTREEIVSEETYGEFRVGDEWSRDETS